MLYLKDVLYAFDIMYAIGGKKGTYVYHPKGENNDHHVMEFLAHMDDGIEAAFPYSLEDKENGKLEVRGGKRKKVVKSICINFLEKKFGKKLLKRELRKTDTAKHIIHEHNWITDTDWDKWLNEEKVKSLKKSRKRRKKLTRKQKMAIMGNE